MKPNQNLISLSPPVCFNRNYSFGLQLLLVNVCVWWLKELMLLPVPADFEGWTSKTSTGFDLNLATQFIIMFMSMGVVLSQGSFSLSASACLSTSLSAVSVWIYSPLFYSAVHRRGLSSDCLHFYVPLIPHSPQLLLSYLVSSVWTTTGLRVILG